MSQRNHDAAPAARPEARVHAAIVQLAQQASIEINVQDVPHLAASRELLASGTKIYVSHLPKQSWRDTVAASRAVRDAGFDPVPHVPVRLLADVGALDWLIAEFANDAGVREVLLIAGDYPQVAGSLATTSDALITGVFERRGYKRISVAGHPEGHPQVALDEIRRAEREKAILAQHCGLKVTFLTQFFFEQTPFLHWVDELRAAGVTARLVGGLAGPANLATLFRFAIRCGVGPSIRALGAKPSSLLKLAGDHGPETVMRGLAESRSAGASDFDGIHLFCFGGYLRTCRWLHAVASGMFVLDERGGFEV